MKRVETLMAPRRIRSLPVRGAWIETPLVPVRKMAAVVAPCEGGVD